MPNQPNPLDAAFTDVENAVDLDRQRLGDIDRERQHIVDHMLTTIDGYLQRNDFNFVTPAFTVAANLIAGETCHAFVWNWVRECVRKYPDPQWQTSLVITVIEPSTEPPVRWSDLMELMKFLAEPDWAEALFAAYDRDGFPENLLSDYAWYSEDMREMKKVPIAFPFDRLASYLSDWHDDPQHESVGH